MNGISISLLRLTPAFKKLMQANTPVGAWPKAVVPSFPTPTAGIKGLDPMEGVKPSSDAAVMANMEKICKALMDGKKLLDDMDAKMVLADKDKYPLADAKATCSCLSAVLGQSMGGSSGVLTSILFMGMADAFAKSGKTWKDGGGQALMAGLEQMMAAGGAQVGSRTMLDALVPAAQALI